MNELKKLHSLVLEGFNKKGLTYGVNLYENHRSTYESAPECDVLHLWKELLDVAFKVGGFFEPISIMQKDDPFLNKGLEIITDKEVIAARRYRQEFPLKADLVLYALQTYRRSRELVDNFSNISPSSGD